MHTYPVFITLASSVVAVVGAGRVGMRKIDSLLEAGTGEVHVFDPYIEDERAQFLTDIPQVTLFLRPVENADIQGKRLVFAATGCAEENARIATLCLTANVLCNVVDAPEAGSFIVPAFSNGNGMLAAFSTGGKSPALARRVKNEANEWLEKRFGPLLVFMGRLRPLVLGMGVDNVKNTVLFRSLVYSRLDEYLASKDRQSADSLIRELLPLPLHCHIEELLDGLC